MPVKAVLVGFGSVGRALLKELIGRRLGIEVAGVLSSRGGVLIGGYEDLRMLYELASSDLNLSKHPRFRQGFSIDELVSKVRPDLAYIVIPPSYRTGEPNKSIYYKLVGCGVSIITADKTVLALGYREFMDYATKKKVFVGYRATVAAGTPFTDVAEGLRGREVKYFRAMFNVTTNYILSLMEQGRTYEEAVRNAIEVKLAEPDPTVDTHGWDLAAKVAIMASILTGENVTISDIHREPLEKVPAEEVAEGPKEGYRIKYLGVADLEKKRYYVGPEKLPLDSSLASLTGMLSGAEFIVEGECMVIIGPAGPAWRTAKVMITDTIEYLGWLRLRGS